MVTWKTKSAGRGRLVNNTSKISSIVRIRKERIAFSDMAIELMRFPQKLMVGYDVEQKLIYFQPTKDNVGYTVCNKAEQNKDNYFTEICCQAIYSDLLRNGINLAEHVKKSYALKYDKNENAYYINLNEAC